MAPSAIRTGGASPANDKDPDPDWADSDELRTAFTLALSAMYKAEVPLYGDLVSIVSRVNAATRQEALDPRVLAMRSGDVSAARLDVERHGAVRLGTPRELATVRRVFALLGLHPVGYYDLAPAGLPMHATCFRPVAASALRANPFRVFTSVLRPELIADAGARALALALLDRRYDDLFSPALLRLLAAAQKQGGRLTPAQGRALLPEALRIFAWRGAAAATAAEYAALAGAHPILADIAAFATPHLNHLTPRTLDITATQAAMRDAGLRVKAHIEGPPPRACPVLLRQTSFLAVEEAITFAAEATEDRDDGDGEEQFPVRPPPEGRHRARFGEVEERGAAVTPAGRALYDALVARALATASDKGHEEALEAAFAEFPDDWAELRRRRLVYFRYRCVGGASPDVPPQDDADTTRLDDLVRAGAVEPVPLTYEDFLPLSAAGIFRSNLGGATMAMTGARPDRAGLEDALGVCVRDAEELYGKMERESIEECGRVLGVRIVEAE